MISLLRISHFKILKSPAIWVSIIFVVFFMSFAPRSFGSIVDPSTPNYIELANQLSLQVSGAIIITGLLITVVTTFGESYVNIKNSLLYQNTKLISRPKYQFYVATIIPVIVFSATIFIFSMVFMFVLDSIGALGVEKNIIELGTIQWFYLILAIATTISLGVSISILFATVSKKTSTYTALIWAYLFLVFFFGGSSVPIFLIRGDDSLGAFLYLSCLVPNVYSNFLFINAISGTIDANKALGIMDIVMPIILTFTISGISFVITKI